MFTTFAISASGCYAQRIRMDCIANNLANVNTTRDAQGNNNPYLRKDPIFKPGGVGGSRTLGVHVPEVITDPKAVHTKYAPGHPDADKDGYVKVPNINSIEEMVNMIDASRAYEANITAMESSRTMFTTSLRLLA